MMVWLGFVAMIVLGAVASVHLRTVTDDEEYGLTPAKRRARSSPDGGYVGTPNTARLTAAQSKRARRRARNRQIAGRGGIHRPDEVSSSTVRWWRRPAKRRR